MWRHSKTRTEGWAAGLQLAALALQGRSDRETFLQAFTGGHRYILGYLVDEVLARQPENVQHFLLKTSILDRLSGDLGDAVTGETGSHVMLEALHSGNLFTIALDEHGEWYRYHHLFQDALRLRLQQTQAELAPTLHRRASKWYEAHGLFEDAIKHALAAHDTLRAGDLIVNAFLPLWMQSELGTLRRWVDSLPQDAFQQHPDLAFWSAALLAYTGQLDLATTRLDLAEALFQTSSPRAPGANEIDQRLGRVAWLRGMLAIRGGAVTQALRQAEQAFALLSPDDLLFRGGTFIVQGNAYLSRDELSEAQHAYEQAAKHPRAVDHWFLLSGALGRLAPIQVTVGRLHAAVASCQQLLALPIVQQGRVPAAGYAHAGLAEVFYQWNELELAAEHADIGGTLGETASIVDLVYAAALTQARVQAALGAEEEAFALIRRAQQMAPQVGGVHMVRRAQAIEALIRLRFAQLDAVYRWERSLGQENIQDRLLAELEGLVKARLRLAEAQPGEAMPILQSLLSPAETAQRRGSVIEILVLEARTLAALGQLEPSIDRLNRA